MTNAVLEKELFSGKTHLYIKCHAYSVGIEKAFINKTSRNVHRR